QVRGEVGATDAVAVGCGDRRADLVLDLVAVECEFGGDWNAEEHARAPRELPRRDACRTEGVVDAVLQAKTARADVERGKLVGAVTEDGYAERLEPLQSQGKVEHELCAGAHHHDRVPGDRLQVRGLVEALLGPAVDPADAAGRQDLDAGGRRDLDRRGNSRSAERTRGKDGRDVTDRDLGHPGLVRE